ncbi:MULTISPECIES: response regulator transcription factor [Priestia]|jgi:two-component system response regulator VanR|uniref:Two-component response regulator n=3 Tax=Priestia TaxID=2800373 RepID=D5DR67_PRIM1|nr:MULTISPECIES: response regulator transcription factor [Priestia]AVX08231.1 DNA-binding response regulator [Bacillus sp. Y-01]KOP74396.1 DeoR faimly transcriptional regulator [Bacillus sp. FJAT-21351]MCJ7986370.1 response regulator transcription factor [Priestia sp. OVL9]MDH6654823.1 DNA-binding response OmpR family regulator [Bacillus sp. PvP124]MDP9575039.1 DNA-binding response OmpR family regulator [Bacillus sp. 1751]RFB40753.1 DNA-binding response regulator [Bacillus sp. RC]
MKDRILIMDDDEQIRNLIAIYLENEGFEALKVSNAVSGLALLEEQEVDLIILDIMMPQMNGIEAAFKIREEKNMPIIMLSAKSEDMDKISGLTAGADDYLTKPFNPLELIARVKSQIRRYKKYNQRAEHEIIQIGDLEINRSTRLVFVRGQEIRLTPKEFDILELLARHKGTVMSMGKIYEAVWQADALKSDSTVMVHITKIREKIEDNPKKPIYIKTIWGVGYRI